MGEITGVTAVVHESYSFACMRCGHGWEQSYEIEHHRDAGGHEFVRYVAGGRIVPSPLSRPTCANCDSHVVRIMRPGRVASARGTAPGHHRTPPAEIPRQRSRRHHLSDLLHALHLQRRAS
ncbi:hypothetical protein GCM10010377_31240 [Streptomyces viridiviolaceus]|uniref:C2H2-type domain-containing protein n=1 Tax=Streptomyces viridiviolaceus TaxID=68282 RepID=A0ABW2EBG0_9ACTN|nr:hypothetical protein [Streptomyces viridiviolaceus]GHB37981.1 hypothetical protein GCM10010377_31240 [Streptomyces viridiviolaceus]